MKRAVFAIAFASTSAAAAIACTHNFGTFVVDGDAGDGSIIVGDGSSDGQGHDGATGDGGAGDSGLYAVERVPRGGWHVRFAVLVHVTELPTAMRRQPAVSQRMPRREHRVPRRLRSDV